MTLDQPDKQYLTTRQYRDASNLNARGTLHARFGSNPYPWFRWLFDQLLTIAPGDARILEVGAGPAGLWAENVDRLPPGWRVTLTDLSEGMVAVARERLAGAQSTAFTCSTADIEELPFPDAAFDVVVANHMLYHVPDRSRALAQLYRTLRPGGALLAATNGGDNLRELDCLILGFVPDSHSREWRASFHHPFTLENGATQLAPPFSSVELRRYEDSLRVTDADALVAYVFSIDAPGLREPQEQAAFTAYARRVMAEQQGTFTISKSVGAFVAHRTEDPGT
jgi:SAM-dependent methyltransferase